MNKISWKQIQSLFPNDSIEHKERFAKLFAELAKQELTVEDIDTVLKTPELVVVGFNDLTKSASFNRYFYDNVGNVIGYVSVQDNGDSQVYDPAGQFQGSCVGGQTFDSRGFLIANSDVVTSFLMIEKRIETT